MRKKTENMYKAGVAFAVAMAFIMPGMAVSAYLEKNSMSLIVDDASITMQSPDLIKITNETTNADIDNYFVVYPDTTYLYIYNIKTGETDNIYVGGNIAYPKISENRVVYYDFVYNGYKMYNINTGEKTDLIVANWSGGGSDNFQFFGDYLVYQSTDSDYYDTEIFLYNIATSENIQLTDTPGEDYPLNPCIYNNIVVWELNEGSQSDIVMYNIDSQNYTRVTNTPQFESETLPSIYDNNIVYSYLYYDKVNGTIIYELRMYNITTENETTIFTGEANSPEIFGNIIVYSESDGRLCLYNLSTNYKILIYESFYLVSPWNLNENYVLFTVLGEGLYLYQYNYPSVIEIGNITGGLFKVKAVIKNTGDGVATNISWSIKLTGGFIIFGKNTSGTIASLNANSQQTISSKLILGFGKTVVTVIADTATKSQNATLLFAFIKI